MPVLQNECINQGVLRYSLSFSQRFRNRTIDYICTEQVKLGGGGKRQIGRVMLSQLFVLRASMREGCNNRGCCENARCRMSMIFSKLRIATNWWVRRLQFRLQLGSDSSTFLFTHLPVSGIEISARNEGERVSCSHLDLWVPICSDLYRKLENSFPQPGYILTYGLQVLISSQGASLHTWLLAVAPEDVLHLLVGWVESANKQRQIIVLKHDHIFVVAE